MCFACCWTQRIGNAWQMTSIWNFASRLLISLQFKLTIRPTLSFTYPHSHRLEHYSFSRPFRCFYLWILFSLLVSTNRSHVGLWLSFTVQEQLTWNNGVQITNRVTNWVPSSAERWCLCARVLDLFFRDHLSAMDDGDCVLCKCVNLRYLLVLFYWFHPFAPASSLKLISVTINCLGLTYNFHGTLNPKDHHCDHGGVKLGPILSQFSYTSATSISLVVCLSLDSQVNTAFSVFRQILLYYFTYNNTTIVTMQPRKHVCIFSLLLSSQHVSALAGHHQVTFYAETVKLYCISFLFWCYYLPNYATVLF
jgi:hypothetical protein